MSHVTTEKHKAFLHSIDKVTGRRRLFAISAVKATERHRTSQPIGIIVLVAGELKAIFVDCILVKAHSGEALAKDIIEICLIMKKLGFSKHQLRQQMTSFAADGQYFALAIAQHIAHLLLKDEHGDGPAFISEEVEYAMQWLLCTWDPAHRLELVLKDVRKDVLSVHEELPELKWYGEIAMDVNEIYSKFTYRKGCEELINCAEQLGLRLYEICKICTI